MRGEYPSLATVLVTHHLEELPATTTHAMLLRDGECLAAGPADEVLTTDLVSVCFDHAVRITRTAGRWAARADRVPAQSQGDGMTPAEIAQASVRLAPVVRRTPLEDNQRLSRLLGVPVLLKREDSQVCRSYKVRGAYNVISSLGGDERARGVVTASAGNHGQGVAFACERLGIRGRVFVPTTTPRQKRQRIAALGGGMVELVVEGAPTTRRARPPSATAGRPARSTCTRSTTRARSPGRARSAWRSWSSSAAPPAR